MWHTSNMTDLGAAPFQIQVQAVWPEGLPGAAQVVNQFAISDDASGPGAVYLMFGHLGAPIFVSQEQAEQRLKQQGNAVPITPRGAFYMTMANAEKLRDLLTEHLMRHA
jgi:hypothetical protein